MNRKMVLGFWPGGGSVWRHISSRTRSLRPSQRPRPRLVLWRKPRPGRTARTSARGRCIPGHGFSGACADTRRGCARGPTWARTGEALCGACSGPPGLARSSCSSSAYATTGVPARATAFNGAAINRAHTAYTHAGATARAIASNGAAINRAHTAYTDIGAAARTAAFNGAISCAYTPCTNSSNRPDFSRHVALSSLG
jgi:hypothetical protein